jgi:TonB family protein
MCGRARFQNEDRQMHKNSPLVSSWASALFVMAMSLYALTALGQDARKTVSNPPPVYPELAKRMNLNGVVKIELVVGADGQVKESKVLGGHPILVQAALQALRDWKYERASSETKVQVEFKFHF